MKALEAGIIRLTTVPTQWPEWFDPDYVKTGPPKFTHCRESGPLNPPRYEPPLLADGRDYYSMVAKYGRPTGRFERDPPPVVHAEAAE